MQLRVGDKISIRQGSSKSPLFTDADKKMSAARQLAWLKLDPQKVEATIQGKPKKEEADSFLNFDAVIEFYTR